MRRSSAKRSAVQHAYLQIHATLNNWEWPGDEATCMSSSMTSKCIHYRSMHMPSRIIALKVKGRHVE